MTLVEEDRLQTTESLVKEIIFAGFSGRPEMYHPGDSVKRENFYGLVSHPFRSGVPNEDISTFLKWHMHKSGDRNIFGILQNFVVQGGWNLLNDEEQADFVAGFNEVRRHQRVLGAVEPRQGENFKGAIKRRIGELFNELIDNATFPPRLAVAENPLTDEAIEKMSWQQFLSWAANRRKANMAKG